MEPGGLGHCLDALGVPECPAQLGLIIGSGIDRYCPEPGFIVLSPLHTVCNPVVSLQLDQAVRSVPILPVRREVMGWPRVSQL